MKIEINQTYTEDLLFSQQDVIDFAKVSGDDNPVHLDAEFAAKTQFLKPIMHGMISGCVFSKVMGTKFPGYGSIYLGQTIEFKRPMFVDVAYRAVFTAISINPEKHRAEIKCEIFDKETQKLTTSGIATVMNLERF